MAENQPAVLGATYAPGLPEAKTEGQWRQKLGGRAEELKYLRSAERYWYSQEWFGSERRRKPA
jgi:hypothetical protein